MPDEVFIYLIVALNVLLQVMLIGRLKFPPGRKKWKYQLCAVAIPVVVVLVMRLSVAAGLMHAHLADQSMLERYLTTAASVALLAGPLLVSLAAVVGRMRKP